MYASDVRKSAAEQIESVGGRFIEVDGMDDFEDASGYAKPLTPEFIQKVNDTVCGVAADADIVITTARIFGRPAPITVPASAVANFKRGSVIVDMNADVGGNWSPPSPVMSYHGQRRHCGGRKQPSWHPRDHRFDAVLEQPHHLHVFLGQ